MIDTMENLRNIAIVAHGGAGKTSIAEAMLFNAKVINRLGRVEDGNTTMDFEPEELKRCSSLSSSFYQFPWKKKNISLIDTPGDQNFFSDTKNCMQACDSAVFVIDGVDGVKVQTEQAWEFAEEFNLPSLIFINKLDRERSDFDRVVQDAATSFSVKPVILQIPIGSENDFKGVVDLLFMKAYEYDDEGRSTSVEIPEDMKDIVETEHEALVENLTESDDELIEKYLEGETISDEELTNALKTGIIEKAFIPVICGSGTKNIGIDLLSDFIVNYIPSPKDHIDWTGTDISNENEEIRKSDVNAPFSAFVFKTVADPYAGRLSIMRVVSGILPSDGTFYNATKDIKERYNQLLIIEGKEQKAASQAIPGSIVAVAKLKETVTGDTLCAETDKIIFKCTDPLPPLISFAISAKKQGDEDKIFSSLSKLLEEDTALKLDRNSETKQILLSGGGQVHIEVTCEKLKRKFNVEVNLDKPKIPYRETIKKKVRVQGKHKKQSGGHGQYGDCWIRMEPLPKGKGFEFVDAIVGGSIPKTYIPAVEKGVVEAAARGMIAGFPCVDFRVTVDDGTFHSVDSSEMAFKIAGSIAFKNAVIEAKPVLLEPIMKIAIKTPDEFMGDIMGDLSSRRGKVGGMDTEGKYQVINATVPLSEFQTYAPDLRSITGGRGTFSMEFSHYDEVPSQISEKVIEEINKEKEE